VLPENFPAGVGVEIHDPDAAAPDPFQRLGLRPGEELLHPFQMGHAADEEDASVAAGKLLQMPRHSLFPPEIVLPRRTASSAAKSLIVGAEADSLYGVGIGERLLVAGVGVQVQVYKGEGESVLNRQSRPFAEGVGRLDEEVDSLLTPFPFAGSWRNGGLVHHDGDFG